MNILYTRRNVRRVEMYFNVVISTKWYDGRIITHSCIVIYAVSSPSGMC